MKAPTGTFLAYATAPGDVALDGAGGNSPFTQALAREIRVEGAPVEQVFKQVRVSVLSDTNGQQTPWDTSSLTREFVFKAAKTLTPKDMDETQLWQAVKASQDPVQIMLFMRSYSDGPHIEEARALLATALEEELSQGRAKPKEPVASMPAPKEIADEETALMERARRSGTLADYEAYLEAFPNGVFAELVAIEVASLKQASETAPTSAPPEEVADTQAPDTETVKWEVYFDQPLLNGPPEILGATLLEVTTLSPLFPPIQGLPEAMWKDQPCANCHERTREALCDQGKFYQKLATARHLSKQHPFGGGFKENLKHWADGNCQ